MSQLSPTTEEVNKEVSYTCSINLVTTNHFGVLVAVTPPQAQMHCAVKSGIAQTNANVRLLELMAVVVVWLYVGFA